MSSRAGYSERKPMEIVGYKSCRERSPLFLGNGSIRKRKKGKNQHLWKKKK